MAQEQDWASGRDQACVSPLASGVRFGVESQSYTSDRDRGVIRISDPFWIHCASFIQLHKHEDQPINQVLDRCERVAGIQDREDAARSGQAVPTHF